jgi:hypothetical protein
MALLVVADYAPITAAAEVQAKLEGRGSFIMKLTRPLRMQRRDRWGIASFPAGQHSQGPGRVRYVVLAEHRCGMTLPVDDPGLVSLIMLDQPGPARVIHQECPY